MSDREAGLLPQTVSVYKRPSIGEMLLLAEQNDTHSAHHRTERRRE